MAKRLYPNIAIFCLKNNEIIGINDNLYDVNVIAKIKLMTFDGQILVN